MLIKILKADLLKKKALNLILAFFMVLASYLVAVSSGMIAELVSSLNYFFNAASAPHYVQMNEGIVNKQKINHWSAHNSLIKKQQIVEMLRIDDSNVFLKNLNTSESGNIMNLDFVTQNTLFDFLLNMQGKIIYPSAGEIAVPIYFMQQKQLKIGDPVRIFNKVFIITDFIRDVQMNPSIIHSKRFLISPNDYAELKNHTDRIVSLIEFQLTSLKDIRQFDSQYQLSDLPKNGPSVDYHLYKILNSVTDGVTIGVIILLSSLMILVAVLCLRFAIITTLEEDFKQLGIMKALGIDQRSIKQIYLAKYALIAGIACITGYIVSLSTKKFFLSNIVLYLGMGQASFLKNLLPLLSVTVIFAIIIISCLWVLRNCNRISAVEALRDNINGQMGKNNRLIALRKPFFLNLNLVFGLKDIFQRWRNYLLLFLVFLISSFVVILPINFFNTIKSPSFITYMGVGRSDIRIDLTRRNFLDNPDKVMTFIKHDKDVKKYALIVTSRYRIKNDNGSLENINIETGQFNVFPVKYLSGNEPQNTREIALSYLNSKQLNKKVGDSLNIMRDGQIFKMKVTGLYQDITYGGKTAKALLPYNPESVLWSVINIDFKPGISVAYKMNEYTRLFYPNRVTNIEDYLKQTLGDLVKQLRKIAILAIIIATCLSGLITSLFLKMLIAKQHSEIAIMRALGFTLKDIRIQYITRTLFVLNLGIIWGAILSNTVGQHLVSLMWSYMGACEIRLIINPWQVYILSPLLLICMVTVAALASIASIKEFNISKLIAE
jgi:putative ABC transport system permease protein